jgi:hypothetical protein
MSITAQEWEFLECFEVEPRLRDTDLPWCYNDALYEVQLGDMSVSCAVAPAYHDLRLIVRRDGKPIYELNADNVTDVRVPDAPGRDVFQIQLHEDEWISIQLRPSFSIRQGFLVPHV